MSSTQIVILAILMLIAFSMLAIFSGIIMADYISLKQANPSYQQPAILSTAVPTKTPAPTWTNLPTYTYTPKPTKTPRPTNTPTSTPIPTKTPWYRDSSENYVPSIEDLPQDFHVTVHGYNYTSDGLEYYNILFENIYPGLRRTDDVYLVGYDIFVLPDAETARIQYDSQDVELIASMEDADHLLGSPVEYPLNLSGVDNAKLFVVNLWGVNAYEIRCLTFIQDENIFAMVQTLVHNTGDSVDNAIRQSEDFVSLLISKMR